jgi:uncharacterized protein YjiS (DUF1127 family)
MSTTYDARGVGQTVASTRRAYSFLKQRWEAFQERRKRQNVRATSCDLCDLSDRELMDIGTTRREIDYMASNRGIDPRGVRPGEWVQYLSTVDGQIGHF